MHLRIAPKIVIRVSTVLTLSASLVYASAPGGRYGVNTTANQETARNVDDRPSSPRLAALQDRLKAGGPNGGVSRPAFNVLIFPIGGRQSVR